MSLIISYDTLNYVIIFNEQPIMIVTYCLNYSILTSRTESNPPAPFTGTTHLVLLAGNMSLSPGTP